jgi:hypothetical protein
MQRVVLAALPMLTEQNVYGVRILHLPLLHWNIGPMDNSFCFLENWFLLRFRS